MSILLSWFRLHCFSLLNNFCNCFILFLLLLQLASSTTPEIEISKDGDTFTIQTKTAIKNSTIKFKIGEEFDEDRQDDVKVKSVIKQEGNKWIHTQTPSDSDKVVTITREFSDKGIVTVATVGGVSSTREYARV